MSHSVSQWFSRALVALLALAGAPASAEDDDASALGFERTPPRLSFIDGEVSYFRPGDADWTAARVNTPLAAGDDLSTGAGANLELQVGARAFLRAGEATQLELTTLEPDYLQLELKNGTASLDLRDLTSGQTFEIKAPNAAFTIERPGYYRVEVTNDATTFTSRRGGRASVQIEGGLPSSISPNEQIVVSGADAPVVATYGAPALDDWDRWNYSRSERQTAPTSARYVPAGVYGADDLDAYGSWRAVPTYGVVWVPRVVAGWAPYSSGGWVSDPYYGWTWVDDAPWGWAPFHYGRWVYVGGYWAWSPGPRVVRAYYSPALVAFYSSGHFSVGVSFGQPYVGWVALGWGEPVVPWWGPRGCRGVARWAGWGGPHVVNNVVITRNTYVNVDHLDHYQHAGRHGAMVAIDGSRFGHGDVGEARLARFDGAKLAPVRGGDLGVRPERGTRASVEQHAGRPSQQNRERRTSAAPTEAPERLARADRSDRHDHGSSRAPERSNRARGRDATPPPQARNQDAKHARGVARDSSQREREAQPRAPSPPQVEERRGQRADRHQTFERAPQVERPDRQRPERERTADRSPATAPSDPTNGPGGAMDRERGRSHSRHD